MQWRFLLGCLLIALSTARLLFALLDFDATSFAVGNLAGGALVLLLGVWLVRSGRHQVRS